ncbi:MAG: hypothetical protein ACFB2W_03200 [Leptolyngbyaceae cyanobacterium]
MWTSQQTPLPNSQGIQISISKDSVPVSYATVINGWQQNKAFRDFFIKLLATLPFTAFRWETPSVSAATANRPFECVIISSPALTSPPDRRTFAPYFKPDMSVVTFPNLRQDAILVVPCPRTPSDDYSYLGAFIKHAPKSQQHALWQTVGHTMQERLGPTPVWLSTAGGGVAWLHVRLDDRPKYYHYLPYCLN